MKVKELIDKLKSYNPQARVVVDKGDYDDVEYSYIHDVGWVYEDEETNKNLVELS